MFKVTTKSLEMTPEAWNTEKLEGSDKLRGPRKLERGRFKSENKPGKFYPNYPSGASAPAYCDWQPNFYFYAGNLLAGGLHDTE